MGRKDWKGGKLKLCDFRLPLRSTWELHSSQSKTALTKAEGTGAVSQSATHQATFPVHFAWMEIELSNLLGCVVHVSWICCKHTGMLDVDPMSHVDAMHSYFSGCPKADSHTACCAHAVPLPCRAAKGLECVFPISFTQCGRVWFTLSMPCPCHVWPCRYSQGYGTARPSREDLWATCPLSASSGYHAEFHEDCYQKHTNPPRNDPYLRL